MPKAVVTATAPEPLISTIHLSRKRRFRLLATLYMMSAGTAGKPISLIAFQAAVGMEDGAFRQALRTLESYRHVQVYNERDRVFPSYPRWDEPAPEVGGRSWDEDEDREGPGSYLVELAEHGHLVFEYMALNPTEPVEVYGTFQGVWDDELLHVEATG